MPKSSTSVRVLLLADSHLGFDLPTKPRVNRRRRGHDFLANHGRALSRAKDGEVDLVVHGGDVFHRARVPPSVVFQAFRPLLEVADSGIPVVIVPGNHERSRIPHDRFASHPNLHIFRRPETKALEVRGTRVALSGFPYERRRIRERFPDVLEGTGWRREDAGIRLLCIHHCVEGATVGPSDYTFRHNPDVIRCSDLPTDFAAVLSGHIHRHQVLRADLQGRPLPTPVLYPGSVERTAFAEKDEEKGYLVLEIEPSDCGGELLGHNFARLPARPMELHDIHPFAGLLTNWPPDELQARIRSTLARVPEDSVLRIRIHGGVPESARPILSPDHLRRISPPEMNLEVRVVEDREKREKESRPSEQPEGRQHSLMIPDGA